MVGISISKKNGFTHIDFVSANILRLGIRHLIGAGYKQGDKLTLTISDLACTQWQIYPIQNGVQLELSGDTEMDTLSTLLRCAADMIDERRGGLTEEETLEYINTEFRAKHAYDPEPQNLKSVLHKMHVGKYKGKLLKDVDDLHYLKWFVENVQLSPLFKAAVNDHIETLSTLMR